MRWPCCQLVRAAYAYQVHYLLRGWAERKTAYVPPISPGTQPRIQKPNKLILSSVHWLGLVITSSTMLRILSLEVILWWWSGCTILCLNKSYIDLFLNINMYNNCAGFQEYLFHRVLLHIPHKFSPLAELSFKTCQQAPPAPISISTSCIECRTQCS